MLGGVRITVVGQGDAAMSVVGALGKIPGIRQVKQVLGVDGRSLDGDIVVDMLGGVEPSFRLGMNSLSCGIPFVTSSSMLVAAHGRVLTAAAVGQHSFLGVSAAGFGLPINDLTVGGGVEKISVVFGDGANLMLGRMMFRAESFAKVENEYIKLNNDLSDAGGKVTQARGAAILGSWCGVWPKVSSQLRVGVDVMDVNEFKVLRDLGLRMVYGLEMTREGFYTGPMVVAAESVLDSVPQQDVMILRKQNSDLVINHASDEVGRMVEGICGDVRHWLALRPARGGTGVALAGTEAAPSAAYCRCYVRCSYTRKEAVLKCAGEVLFDRVDGNGQWLAVVEDADLRELRLLAYDGCVLPLVGSWELPQAGLRLVG